MEMRTSFRGDGILEFGTWHMGGRFDIYYE